MMKIVIALSLLVALAQCYPAPSNYQEGPQYGYQPQPHYNYQPQEYYEDRDYKFNYYVNDDYTYNHQTRNEQKYGKTVTGQYTLVEPTGLLRVVDYIADDYGFRANVKHQPQYQKGPPNNQQPSQSSLSCSSNISFVLRRIILNITMAAIQVVILCVILSVVCANPAVYYPQPAPVKQQPYEERDYKFGYAVKDAATYNQQSREETKYGNTVTGQYTVLEPNGEIRVVNYIADDNGFRAEVLKQPTNGGYAAPAPLKSKGPYYAKAPLAY
ncbi:hypothetical protein CHUAL_006524 [Chamberlinius hualienensis]